MSRFVSAGAINAETGEAVVDDAAASTTGNTQTETKKSAEWELVQKELDAERKRREEARVKAVEGGEKSLYDVLQANKAAKQAAFEEANKIKNQFRPLDDDEIEFLDEVRQSARAEEERVRRETEEGLAAFRAAQKRPGPAVDEGDDVGGEKEADAGKAAGEEEWAVGPRKRRKGREGLFGVRREKSDAEKKAGEESEAAGEKKEGEGKTVEAEKKIEKKAEEKPAPTKPKMGLVAYGSDSDDD
ncbi:hypothetical protein CMUS01_03940 [Colletotrichum musicola]|uniref:FAM192A/Fyv6 N-terminal domain-containing protein n=1 Tax=Colletotrichum musicola TaxID=2175873 RepID=A0A8H6U3S4_9PEZI|nr:hypothetical protein CMUS01_03940 [Colletotrichum musicola]